MKRPSFDPEERIFTLSDIIYLFKTLRKKLILIACVCGLFGSLSQIVRAPRYLLEATFKEGVEKSEEGGLKDLLGGFGMTTQQPQAIVLMKSHQVLRPLIEKFGLQLSVPQVSLLKKFGQNLANQWESAMRNPLKEPDWFVFKEVSSKLEKKDIYALRFTSLTSFELLDKKGALLAQGEVGNPVQTETLSFICQKTPSTLQIQTLYPLHFVPWLNMLQQFKSSLKIVSHKNNKSIYDLSLESTDRALGAALLNGLMEEYQHYLRKEHDQVASEQIAYLEGKQTQIYEKMGHVFDEHAAYLRDSLTSRGFIGLQEGMESFVSTHENLRGKILNINVELEQLKLKQTSASCLGESPFARTLLATVEKTRELEQQRDLLELALQDTSPQIHMETLFGELSSIRAQKIETQQLSASLATNSLSQLPPQFAWGLKSAELTSYLQHHLHLLSVQEKMLQERLIHPIKESEEFQGIGLETSQALYIQYTHKLDLAEGAVHRFEHLKEELKKKEIELASLSSLLEDGFSREIIQQASKLSHLLKDEKHRTEKELERWTQDLEFQKRVLFEHVEQMQKLEQLNAKLTREKMASLQRASLSCIHQQLSLAKEKYNLLVEQRKTALTEEKELLTQKMAEMRAIAADLPERWKLEHWLELKTEMGTKIMSVMTELVESKTIGRHLHHVESKPLDRAVAPLLAKKPKFLEMGFLFSLGAAFFFFFASLFRNLFKGFPLSADKLQALRFPFSGTLQKEGQETLRRLSLFIEGAKTIALVGGQGPNYANNLAHNLARSGHSVLLIDCEFQGSNTPGLFQWLEKKIEAIPFQTDALFHTILSGGTCPYSVELLRSKRFEELLSEVKTRYDIVLLWQKNALHMVGAVAPLSLVDKAIVTISNEQTESLTPFIEWAYHEDNCRLTFVTA
ncbi:MAG TPA: hypothetical protein VGM34_01350 [Chlamydiales bacterium]